MIDKTPDIIRKVKNLGFPCPYQLYLAERRCTFYWVGNGGMGTIISTEVSPEEADAILDLLNSKTLLRTEKTIPITHRKLAYTIILKSDITDDTMLLPDYKVPGNKECFLKKIELRQQKNHNFRGLVKIENDPDITTPYAWCYYAGMGNVHFINVSDTDIAIIDLLLRDSTFTFEDSYPLGTDIQITPIIV